MIKYPKYLEKGMKFGKLTVIEVDEKSKYKNETKIISSRWKYKCQCDCGNITSVRKDSICSGHTISCGHCLDPIEIERNVIKLFLKNSGNYTIIDTEDYHKIKEYHWGERIHGYVAGCKNKKRIYLHRLILDVVNTPDVSIDHINGNKLDNRKCNLRVCAHSQNTKNHRIPINNTSGILGVWWHKQNKKWVAEIWANGKKYYLGCFIDIKEANKVRQEAEIKYFGEFAPCLCNQPIEEGVDHVD